MAILIESRSDSRLAREDLSKLNKSVESIKGSVDKTTESFKSMTNTITNVLGGVAFVSVLAKQSDELTSYRNKLKVVSDSQEEFLKSFSELRKIAFRSASGLNSVTSLYSRLALGSKRLGASQKDLLKITEAVGKSLKLAGASTQEANSALIQFGQAIASGRLAGDELRSILENAPTLALTIADSIGVSIGELRKMGEAGSLTATRVLRGVLEGADEIDRRFALFGTTYGSAFTRLGLALGQVFNNAKEQIFGTRNTIAEFISSTAKRIQDFADNIGFYIYNVQIAINQTTVRILKLFDVTAEGFKALLFQMSIAGLTIGFLVFNAATSVIAMIPGLLAIGVAAVKSLYTKLETYFKGFSFKFDFTEFFFGSVNTVGSGLSRFINSVFARIKQIKVMDYFPGLATGLAYIKEWALKVNYWFWFIFDKAVGRSWIPDLVISVTTWLAKLLGPALGFVRAFATQANSLFAGIVKGTVGLFAIKGILEYRKVLFSIVAVLGTIVGLAGAISFQSARAKFATGKTDTSKSIGPPEEVSLLRRILDSILNLGDIINKRVRSLFSSEAPRADGVVGPGVENTLAMKTVGVFRNFANSFGTLLSNSVATKQNAIATSIAGVLLIATLKSSSGLKFLFTSIIGSVWTSIVSSTDPIGQRIGKGFSNFVQKSLDILLGSNVFEDFKRAAIGLGVALTLFSGSFRGAVGGTLLGVAKAPAQFAQNGFQRLEMLNLERLANATQRQMLTTQKDLGAQLRRLGAQREITATTRVPLTSKDRFGATTRDWGINNKALSDIDGQIEKLTRINKDSTDSLTKSRDSLRNAANTIRQGLDNSAALARQAFTNFAVGLGGVLGGIAGFQFGRNIAEGINAERKAASQELLSEAQEWGLMAGTAFVGQALGAFGGAAAARFTLLLAGAMLAAIPAIGAAIIGVLTLPVIGPILLAIAAVSGLYLVLKLAFSEGGKEFFAGLRDAFIEGATAFADAIKEKASGVLNGGPIDRIMGAVEIVEQSSGYLFDKAKPLISDTTLKELVDTILLKITGALKGKQASTEGFASGGSISGPGSGTSDSILARLSNGEYVINAASTKKYRPLIEAINKGQLPAFAEGGMAGNISGMIGGLTGLSSDVANGAWLATHLSFISASKRATALEVLLTDKFNSNNKDKRINNFVAGDADEDVYALMRDTAKTVVTKMAASNSLLLIPGIGQFLKVYSLLSGLGVPVLQGATKALLDTGSLKTGVTGIDSLISNFAEMGSLDVLGSTILKPLQQFLKTGLSGFASGGAISGEGSGTSDSILARLSNGEYVINAASTKKYRPLIEAINRGSLPSFSTGGAVEGQPGFVGPSKPLSMEDLLRQVVEAIKGIPDFFKDKFGGILGGAADEVTASIGATNQSILDALKASGISALTASDINAIPTAQLEQIVAVLDDIAQSRKDIAENNAKDSPNMLLDRTANAGLNSSTQQLSKLLSSIPSLDNISGLFNLAEDLGTLGEQFKLVEETLPNLALTFEEFANLGTGFRRSIARGAGAVNSQFGAVENSKDDPTVDTASLLKSATSFKTSTENAIEAVLNTLRTSFDGLNIRLKESGLELGRYAYNLLSSVELVDLERFTSGLQAAAVNLNVLQDDISASPSQLRLAQAVVDNLKAQVGTIIDRAALRSTDLFEDTSAVLNSFGINLSRSIFNRLSEAERASLIDVISKMEAAKIDTLTDDVALTNIAQNILDGLIRGVEIKLQDKSSTFDGKADQAGLNFAESTKTAFNNGLSDAMKGRSKDGQSILETFAKGFLDDMTNSIIDTFASGLTEKLFEGLSESLAKVGKDLFSSGGGVGSAIASIGSSILGAFGFGGGGAAIPGKAEGGMIGGNGTGTSDSNLIWASKGEYVVKANATKKNLALLEAVNSGRIGRFAAGGLVGGQAPMPESAIALSGQTVFNVSITGDISKQTRAEMARMMPELASGVNHYNREKGIRG